MHKPVYSIKQMSRKDLELALDWAVQEGWNPGLFDADCFYQTDPQGFFMGFLDNEPVSSISAVAYDDNFGFLGFYIVKPKYRGKGYGKRIWNHAINYLKTQNIGLDGVVSQQENYKKSGFKLAYRNIRFQGKSKRLTCLKTPGRWPNELLPGGGVYTIPLSSIPFDDVLNYDNKFFPVARPQFLKNWLKLPESKSLGVMKNDKLSGFGTIRKCKNGFKIGPLFTDDENMAEQLFLELSSFPKPDSDIFLDVPKPNKKALNLAYKYKMKSVFETARMYTKKSPTIPLDKIFGITSFELG